MCIKPRNKKLKRVDAKLSEENCVQKKQSLLTNRNSQMKFVPRTPSILDALKIKNPSKYNLLGNKDEIPKRPMSIEEQYNHPLWYDKILEIMHRDRKNCKICGARGSHLSVFPLNLRPKGYIWEEDPEALQTVCDSCREELNGEFSKLVGIIAFELLAGKIDLTNLSQLL